LCIGILDGRAGRLTCKNGDSRPGQCWESRANPDRCAYPGVDDSQHIQIARNQSACVEPGRLVCRCVTGFVGSLCETNVDDCASYPCSAAATCVDLVDRFYCACAPGWSGWACDVDIDECASSPCVNFGVCRDSIDDTRVAHGSFWCVCQWGWVGDDCSINADECESSPCLNGAICTDIHTSYQCECVDGWAGYNCAVQIDECASDPCLHGGVCSDRLAKYFCGCPPQVRKTPSWPRSWANFSLF
jgi:hypothetical protein